MATRAEHIRLTKPEIVTANDRLKDSFNGLAGASIALAALIHFLAIAFWPSIDIEDFSFSTRELLAIEVPPQLEIPPPPADIPRPQVPIVSTNVDIRQDITIQEVTFASNPVGNLPPPPTPKDVSLEEQPAFTPRTIEPKLGANQRTALQRYMERHYPRALLDAGIGARAVLWVYINTEGEVRNTRVVQTSGHQEFDEIAQAAVRTVTFTPAWNLDTRVPVWIQLPLSMDAR
jgi:periplasmic protein TonB